MFVINSHTSNLNEPVKDCSYSILHFPLKGLIKVLPPDGAEIAFTKRSY